MRKPSPKQRSEPIRRAILALAVSLTLLLITTNIAATDCEAGEETLVFGFEPPGTTPEIFAPGVVSLEGSFEFAITFTPEMDESFFTRRVDGTNDNRLMHTTYRSNVRSEPSLAPFAVDCFEYEPHVTPDGSRIMWGSERPLTGQTGCNNRTLIWCAAKTETGWALPEFWGPPFDRAMFVTAAEDGTMYNSGLSKSEPFEGTYGAWVPLGYHLSGYGHPCISPDESFIIFDTDHRRDPESNGLYISFRTELGGFGPAKQLKAALDIGGGGFCASLSPDGKYLFFSSEGDIYWVSTEILSGLKDTDTFNAAFCLSDAVNRCGIERGVMLCDSSRVAQSLPTPTSEGQLNSFGYYLLRADRTDEAVRVFRLNTERHPESGNVFDSYGEVLLTTGDTLAAITNYRRSLELDSGNDNARRVLRELSAD